MQTSKSLHEVTNVMISEAPAEADQVVARTLEAAPDTAVVHPQHTVGADITAAERPSRTNPVFVPREQVLCPSSSSPVP
jgi:hypothetical protein